MITFLGCPICRILNTYHKFSLFITRKQDESDKSTTRGIRCLLCHFLAICNQVFDSIMVNLASHATKTVKLGSQNVVPQVELLGDNNHPSFVSQVRDNNISSSSTRNIENGSSERKSRAPKKMVSINDKVEEFYMSNKRKRMVEKWPSMDDQKEEIKPLKSILKVGSKQRRDM